MRAREQRLTGTGTDGDVAGGDMAATVADDAPVTRGQKVGWALLHIAVPYAWTRAQRWTSDAVESAEPEEVRAPFAQTGPWTSAR